MTTLFDVDRAPVKLSAVPKQTIDAVLAIEDRKFYEHNGVDFGGNVPRAPATSTPARSSRARSDDHRAARQEHAHQGSQARSEDEGPRGRPRDAARERADQEPDPRGLPEPRAVREQRVRHRGRGRALLQQADGRPHVAAVGVARRLVQAPSALDPIRHPAEAARRRRQVLQAMVQTHKITCPASARPPTAPLPTRIFYPEASQRSYYIDALLDQLGNPDPTNLANPANVLGKTRAEARDRLYRGGLRIYTNYDPVMQYWRRPRDLRHHSDRTSRSSRPRSSRSTTTTAPCARWRSGAATTPASSIPRSTARAPGRFVVQGHHARGRALERVLARRPRGGGYSLRWRLGPGNGSDAFYNLSGDCHGGDPTLHPGDREVRQLRVRAHRAVARAGSLRPGRRRAVHVIDGQAMGINTSHFSRWCRPRSAPTACTRSRWRRPTR